MFCIQICLEKHQAFNAFGQQASVNWNTCCTDTMWTECRRESPKTLACVEAWLLNTSVTGTGKKLLCYFDGVQCSCTMIPWELRMPVYPAKYEIPCNWVVWEFPNICHCVSCVCI